MSDGPQAVILAAGKGTRMRSSLPKVLHPLAGRPLLDHVINIAVEVTGRPPIVVVSPAHPEVAQAVGDRAQIVEQEQARGTGDALRSAGPLLRGESEILVLSADVPLLRAETIRLLLERHRALSADCTLLTFLTEDPSGMGRIARGPGGGLERIIEEADLLRDAQSGPAGNDSIPSGMRGDPVPAQVGGHDAAGAGPVECNAGVYVFRGSVLWAALHALTPDNAQGELYLTDVIRLLEGRVEAIVCADPLEALGINDRRQLAYAGEVLRRRLLDSLMLAGVTVEDPGTTYIDAAVVIGADSLLRPMTVLEGATVLGSGCVVGPMAQLRDVHAGDRVIIGSSQLEGCRLSDDVTVGHFDRVRPDTTLDSGVMLGTHAEVKNSRVGKRTQINHFCCVLDSDLGSDVNIGAGTVTCNYDGAAKNRIVIDDDVFVGSDSILVAPLHIGTGAYIAAGSVITNPVDAGALAIERAEQRSIDGWAARRRARQAASGA